jgi:hypothetical protein
LYSIFLIAVATTTGGKDFIGNLVNGILLSLRFSFFAPMVFLGVVLASLKYRAKKRTLENRYKNFQWSEWKAVSLKAVKITLWIQLAQGIIWVILSIFTGEGETTKDNLIEGVVVGLLFLQFMPFHFLGTVFTLVLVRRIHVKNNSVP